MGRYRIRRATQEAVAVASKLFPEVSSEAFESAYILSRALEDRRLRLVKKPDSFFEELAISAPLKSPLRDVEKLRSALDELGYQIVEKRRARA